MNMLIIKVNRSVTYVQKTSQIPSVQLSELSQGEHYKPVREIRKHDQHPETTLEFPLSLPQR